MCLLEKLPSPAEPVEPQRRTTDHQTQQTPTVPYKLRLERRQTLVTSQESYSLLKLKSNKTETFLQLENYLLVTALL